MKQIKFIGMLLITCSTVALTEVKTEDLNSDSSAQMAYKASLPFDGTRGVSGGASAVSVGATHNVVAPYANKDQKPQSGSVPSREERTRSEGEKVDELAMKGAKVGIAGWALGVLGGLAQSPVLAGIGLATWGLGVGLAGAALWQSKEMGGTIDKVIGGGVIANALGTWLLDAAMIAGAPAAILALGGILFVVGALVALGGIAVGLSK